MTYDLSIVIPALKEEWLAQTVEDILKNKRGKTEVIVVLDGEWSTPGVADHPDVRIIKLGKNAGQRGATNIGVRLSQAKYVAKTDAHCAFDTGFDTKLMDAMAGHDDYTIVPAMRNLHIFNWRCLDCGYETYQGPPPEGCKNCDVNTPDRFEKRLVWYPKPSPKSTAYRFTPDRLQFKYFGALKQYQTTEVAETMSLQGSFFMLTRAKYWELDICDESWGGWGQQGTEVALKTWLSGGTVVCHTGTWYAHMFRTQGGFAFPWGNPAKQQEQARKQSLAVFYNNTWDKQVRGLSWLLERFWPALQAEHYQPDKGDRAWTQADLTAIKATEGRFMQQEPSHKGIIFYTDNQLNLKLAHKVQGQLKSIGLPIVSASLKPMPKMGTNVVVDGERSYTTMFKQIIAALETSRAEIVFFCEHDVLYHPSHFDFTPPKPTIFYYNHNWWSIGNPKDKTMAVHWDANRVSQLCCYREHALKFYKQRLADIEAKGFNRSYEPGGRNKRLFASWRSAYPNIDIRHPGTLTGNKWSLKDFKDLSTSQGWQTSTIDNIAGWDDLSAIV